MNDLGARISAEVQREIAPLRNLGARINAEVQESLRPLMSKKIHNEFDTDEPYTGSGSGGNF